MQAASATAEAEARAALRAVVAAGETERSIAEQPWEPVPGGADGWLSASRLR